MMLLRERCAQGVIWLEYIEGTPARQFINTGVAVHFASAAVDCKWSIESLDGKHVNYVPVFGNYDSESKPVFRIILSGADDSYYANINNLASKSMGVTGMNVGLDNPNLITMKAGVIIANGRQRSVSPSGVSYTNNNPVILFGARSYAQTNYVNYRERMYSFTVRDGETPILDLRPCLVRGEVGMYDLVSKRFLGNSGTGQFTAGPKK